MKKDDVVTVGDFSWAERVTIKESLNDCTKEYVIVKTGCSFPLHDGFSPQSRRYRNDTIIRATDDDEVILIHGGFLRPVIKPREVTMADVCRQFGEEVKIKKD